MDWTTLLFSFKGRINRGKYWLAVLIYMAVWTAFIAGMPDLARRHRSRQSAEPRRHGTADLADRAHPSRSPEHGPASPSASSGCMTATRAAGGSCLFWLGPSILGGWQTDDASTSAAASSFRLPRRPS